MTKTNSTKNRLTVFFLSVGVTSVWLCLFIFLFFLIYQNRYQQELRQISDFSEYSDALGELQADLNLYSQKEDERYFDEAEEELQLLLENIELLFTRERKAALRSQLQEMKEMTGYLQRSMEALRQEMAVYLASGKQDFSLTKDKYDVCRKVIEAIQNRCTSASHMFQTAAGEFYDLARRRTRLLIPVFLLFFLLLGIIVFSYIKGIQLTITLPLDLLTQKASLVREGNLSGGRELKMNDKADQEIAALSGVFDDMTLRLEEQFDALNENARIRQELQLSQFKELQMQINPHFMFNTLNMIAERAYLENADDTVELLESAARMFRYSLDFSGKSVTLAKEIEELGIYIFLQEQRFDKRIRFIFDLDESFHDQELPSLTLQPLVENAIVHGVGVHTQQALVYIRTYLDEKDHFGCISVEDNGCGMNAAKLKEVRMQVETYQGNSAKIGLGNVAMRVRYFFDGRAQFSIDSKAGEGTRVTLKIPLRN